MLFNKSQYQDLSNCIRVLVVDAISKANSGHPGMPLGMADVMTVLVFEFLKFNPNDVKWFNRDRLVLSAGHGSMLLYAFFYLAGYKDFHIEDLKNFRQLGSKTAGHPEHCLYDAIETTTGPLGQGLGNAVGMAIAQKKYNQYLNKTLDYKIYTIVGDGCLMEGISYEAASLAGHLMLNNLVVLFDDNKISIDGNTNLAISEDQKGKFISLGWNVETADGHDFQSIYDVLDRVQNSDKPSIIFFQTTIGKYCSKEGSEEVHGTPLNNDEIILLKHKLNMPKDSFVIPNKLLNIWQKSWEHNKDNYKKWNLEYTNLSNEQKSYINNTPNINSSIFDNITLSLSEEATRVSFGKVMQELIKYSNKVICGSADLSFSNNIKNDCSIVINKNDFSGNFIHYGIREHAMASIMNGLALSGFLPIGSTFLVFADYMRPAIRLSAIMRQHVIYIMTHDSIGVGEDGATHQPVEQLASIRAIPNLYLMRPADLHETIINFKFAISNPNRPYVIALTRQKVKPVAIDIDSASIMCGGYILKRYNNDINDNYIDINIIATGSEVFIALEVARVLADEDKLKIHVVSMPCMELFFNHDREYINKVLCKSRLNVGIEAACSFGWEKIIGRKGLFFGVNEFGLSAPSNSIYKHFGLEVSNIVSIIKYKLKNL